MNSEPLVKYTCECGDVLKIWYDKKKMNLFRCECGNQYVIQSLIDDSDPTFTISKLTPVVVLEFF